MGVTREENRKRFYSDLPSLNRTKRVRFQNNGTMLLCLLYSEEKKQLFRNYSFKIMINKYNLNDIDFIQNRNCKIDCSSVI